MAVLFVVVPNIPLLRSASLLSISVRNSCIIAELQDEAESRFSLVFDPYQALRITASDCYIPPDNVEILRGKVIEVIHSEWLAELADNLKKVDESANFMNQARHFIVPLQDDFLEVACWDIKVLHASASPDM